MPQSPDNFLGLEPRYADYAKARYAVLPIPYDGTTSYQSGTRNGPAAIIRASQQVELFDEELEGEFYRAGVATLSPITPNMSGPAAMSEDIVRVARRIVRDGKFPLSLGGEHSITAGLVQAMLTRHKNLCVLQIDAHADLRNEYEGSAHSHACVMRRIRDMGCHTIAVGIRNLSLSEFQYARKSKANIITARQCRDDDAWYDAVLESITSPVYVTIDIDAFDPAYAPGTGTPEPGGLDWYDVTSLLRLLAMEKSIVGADIVEVMPIPGQAVTEFLAARLAYKLIAYIESGKNR